MMNNIHILGQINFRFCFWISGCNQLGNQSIFEQDNEIDFLKSLSYHVSSYMVHCCKSQSRAETVNRSPRKKKLNKVLNKNGNGQNYWSVDSEYHFFFARTYTNAHNRYSFKNAFRISVAACSVHCMNYTDIVIKINGTMDNGQC